MEVGTTWLTVLRAVLFKGAAVKMSAGLMAETPSLLPKNASSVTVRMVLLASLWQEPVPRYDSVHHQLINLTAATSLAVLEASLKQRWQS